MKAASSIPQTRNRVTKTLLAGALAAGLSGSAHAGTAAGTYTAIGAGKASCGPWTTDYYGRTLDSIQEWQWVLGFLGGVGWWWNSRIDPGDYTDADGVRAWITQYCGQHPTDLMAQAAAAFVYFTENNPRS